MFVPSILLKQLYTHGSLTKTDNGVSFALKNRLKDATLKELKWISFDGEKVPSHKISIQSSNDSDISFKALNGGHAIFITTSHYRTPRTE